jgi:sulfur carrier protein ThiS
MIKLIKPDGSSVEIEHEAPIESILEDHKINPVEVIVAKNGTIVSEFESAQSGDEIKVIRIIHGG